jgi:hypothetical protein
VLSRKKPGCWEFELSIVVSLEIEAFEEQEIVSVNMMP